MLFWLCFAAAACADVQPRGEAPTIASDVETPPALCAAWLKQVQNDAGPEYRIAAKSGNRFEARHPRQDLRTRFSDERVELTDREGGQPLRMRLARINGRAPGQGVVSHDRNRVTLSRTGIDEWYVHEPLGIE